MKAKFCKLSLYINYTLFFLIVAFGLVGPTRLFSIAGSYFPLSFYISIIAIPFFYVCYFFFYNNKFLNETIKNIFFLFLILFVTSLSMGYFLYPKYNGLFMTSPTKIVIINSIKYAYDLSLIPYFLFFMSILNAKTIRKVFVVFLTFWILFGAFQVLVFYINNEKLWSIYDKIDLLKIIGGNSSVFARIRINYAGSFRFFGIATEPASNSLLISIIIIPFLLSEIKRWTSSVLYKIFLILSLIVTLVFSYLTKSASVYLGLFIIGIYLFYKLLHSKILKNYWKIIAISSVFFAVVLFFSIEKTRDTFVNKFLYKIIDSNDYSTQHRYSTIWNDIKVFLAYPIFGVGDGNQGYLYSKNLIGTWMANNNETLSAIKGESGLLNGGSAIPSLISGFGIFGTILLVYYLRNYYRHWSRRNHYYSKMRSFLIISGIIICVMSIASQGIHRNYLLLLIISSVALFNGKCENISQAYNFVMSNDTFVNTAHRRIINYAEVSI